MSRRGFRKPTLREMKLQSWESSAFYARMAGKEPPPPPDIKPKRERKPNGSSGQPLEADTLRAVGELLAAHPKVLFAVRQNSGAMQYESAGGRSVPVWFYKWAKRAAKMRISDHWGLLTDGRMFAFESKRAGWRGPSDLREFEQLEFINTVKAAGGIGGFVTSADDALALLA